MGQQWDANEEEVFAATRRLFDQERRTLRLGRWANWVSTFAFGAGFGASLTFAAQHLADKQSTLLLALLAPLVLLVLIWFALDRAAQRAKREKLSHTFVGTENIRRVAFEEATEKAAE